MFDERIANLLTFILSLNVPHSPVEEELLLSLIFLGERIGAQRG
jgi:hypothetical protein